MALQILVGKTSISADGTTLVFSAITGAYSAGNTGGYGAPNETRATLYLFAACNLRKSTGREPIAIPAFVAITASIWTVILSEDGWYELYLFGCYLWSAVITYQQGNIVYDLSSNAFYKSIAVGTNLNNAVTNPA